MAALLYAVRAHSDGLIAKLHMEMDLYKMKNKICN